jgi:phospholipid/cholesterol/gamma-HCH transport system substrate-binding protein
MSKVLSAEAKVGIFVFIGLVILGYMSLKVGDFKFGREKGYNLFVDFTNAAGLAEDADVRVAGVSVGKVDSIYLKGSKAHISLEIAHGVRLEKDVRALIKTAGVLGEKYVEITPGKSKEYLNDGDEIISTISPADLDNLMNQVSEIAEDIKSVASSLKDSIGSQEGTDNIKDILVNVRDATSLLKDVMEKNDENVERLFTNLESITSNVDEIIIQNDDNISSFITNFEELSGRLNSLVESNNYQISQIVANLNDFTDDMRDISSENKKPFKDAVYNLKSFSDDLSEKTPEITSHLQTISSNLDLIIDENRPNVKEGIENINSASKKLKDTLGSLDVVAKRVEDSEGTIGKLINEDTTYDKINETFTGINNFLNRAERFKTFVEFRSEYLSEPSEFKHYLNLKLQPNQDKYYFLEIVDDPEGSMDITDKIVTTQVGVNPPETTITHEEITKDKLKFSVGIAKRYYNLVLRGGIIESTGGFGFDYYFFNDGLKFSFDAYDFNNDDSAHLKAALKLKFLKHIFVTAGYDDFIKHDKDPSYFYGAGFSFSDEDLKYLLTSAPIPAK